MGRDYFLLLVAVAAVAYLASAQTTQPAATTTQQQQTTAPAGQATPQPCQNVTDVLAQQLVQLWAQAFPGAALLPVFGIPSLTNGTAVLTHTTSKQKLSIDGLMSNSPLANNARYSTECINGHYLNLYEIMLPDIPGADGNVSTGEMYVNALGDNGLNVAGVHFVSLLCACGL
jgi:hypothetical protein